MSFIKKSVPPPIVDKGDRFLTSILEMEYPVEGEYGEQIKWRLQLPKKQDGYEATVWTSYYEKPSDKSILGQLCMTYMKVGDEPLDSVDDVLKAIKQHGQVYVECSGHRKWQDQEYPKFQIYPNKMPGRQKPLEENAEVETAAEETDNDFTRQLKKMGIKQEAFNELSGKEQAKLIRKLSMQQ